MQLTCSTLTIFLYSTVSSGLNSLAAICLEDFVRPFCCVGMSDARATNVSKGLAMGFGLLCFGLVFVASQLGNVLEVSFHKYCRKGYEKFLCSIFF